MSEPNTELKNIIEAALLVAGQPLTIEKMLTMFPSESPPTREEIRAVLEMLEEEYAGRVVELKQIDRSWRFQTRDKYASWITRLAEERPVRYSRALLETLAIIAYRQPVTRGDIENIRGVSVSTDIIKTLLGREWIRQVGVRNVPGRPALYGTTREFLEHFNLKNLEELPPLSALRDLDVISNELNLRLDLEQGAGSPAAGAAASDAESPDGLEQEPEPIMSEARTAERE
jgi:segregation and condensation protein B